MSRDAVIHSASQCYDGYGIYGLSVEAAIGIPVDRACSTSPRLCRYGRVRISTVGRLRGAMFVLLPSFDHPHFTIALPDLSELTLRRLDGAFDPAIPNPGRGHGR